MLAFLIIGMTAALYELSIHGKYALLSNAASAHGAGIDEMMKITFVITGFVFIVTHIALFGFAFKYRAKKGVKALHYSHNDKLEIIWTAIPAVVLTILVLGGLKAWNGITKRADEGSASIEVFAQQFAWQVRYPGADAELGNANSNLISEVSNPLGVATKAKAEVILEELEKDITYYTSEIKNLPLKLAELKSTLGGREGKDKKAHLKLIEDIESGSEESFYNLQLRRRATQIKRIDRSLESGVMYTKAAFDDIVSDEIHLVVDQQITMKFRSRDVIHSALMKEFRAQMNGVPCIPTQFTFTPILTTEKQREILNNVDFDYHIICNKICGNSHFSMKIKIIVEDQKSYDKWMSEQKATFALEASPNETTEPEVEKEESSDDHAGEVAMNQF